ncbi:MAG: XdhC family protein [Pseudonocardiaceae bacterium]
MAMDGWDVLERARELSMRGEAFALATVVWRRGPSSGKEGYRAVITTSGQVFGFIGGACAEPVVVREARRILAEGVPRLVFLGTPDELESVAVREGISYVPMSCQSEGALEIFIEPVEPKTHLVVVGRSPMVEALVQMGQAIGWRTVLVDPDGGSAENYPSAQCVVSELDFKVAGVDVRSLVVVATQGHHDEEAVEQALLAGPAYVGLVGSRPRAKSVFDYLEGRGLSKETLGRVKVPAGLDLGRVSHREIAVGVLAELVQLRAAGEFIKGVRPELPEVAEAVDPVCNMTVEVGSARHKIDHGGNTYYFCCAGCLKVFSGDPAAFIGTSGGKESE